MNQKRPKSGVALPRLDVNATFEDVKKYLEWLSESKYDYHIDDDPSEIWSFSEEEQEILKHNSDIMWEHSSDKYGTNLWNAYPFKMEA